MPRCDYDVVVVGGGIHGAGVASLAARAGLRVLLVEKQAIAAGTSSRSSKLIHGGLRYLESGQFRLVRECLRERRILLNRYPDLVRLTPHYLPVYRKTSRRPWQLRFGLSLYALLGGLQPAARFHRLRRDEWADLDGLTQLDLQKVYRYYDAQTDDAALTQRVIEEAQQASASVWVPARLVAARRAAGRFDVDIAVEGETRRITTETLVNAAGPWVNQVVAAVEAAHPAVPVDWVAGTHVVYDAPLHKGVYYVESPRDRRAVFVMPWRGNQTLVGTTERVYQGDPDAVAPTESEIQYLHEVVTTYFPRFRDIRPVTAFAGLRVLPAAAAQPFGRSRETYLAEGAEGKLISIYGGKLTAFRAVAERVVGLLGKKCFTTKDTKSTK